MADLHLGLRELLCEQNDLEAATWHLQRSEELSKNGALRQTPYRQRARSGSITAGQGDVDGALASSTRPSESTFAASSPTFDPSPH